VWRGSRLVKARGAEDGATVRMCGLHENELRLCNDPGVESENGRGMTVMAAAGC
jgi:hypothetical protein